jgi:hypothetical protein
MSARRIFEKLVEHATGEGVITHSGGTAQDYGYRGREIPEWLLPGRLVMRQPPEARAALAALTEADARCRDDVAVFYSEAGRPRHLR